MTTAALSTGNDSEYCPNKEELDHQEKAEKESFKLK